MQKIVEELDYFKKTKRFLNDQHMSNYVDIKTRNCIWNPLECCVQRGNYLLHEPSYFKTEFSEKLRILYLAYRAGNRTVSLVTRF